MSNDCKNKTLTNEDGWELKGTSEKQIDKARKRVLESSKKKSDNSLQKKEHPYSTKPVFNLKFRTHDGILKQKKINFLHL